MAVDERYNSSYVMLSNERELRRLVIIKILISNLSMCLIFSFVIVVAAKRQSK